MTVDQPVVRDNVMVVCCLSQSTVGKLDVVQRIRDFVGRGDDIVVRVDREDQGGISWLCTISASVVEGEIRFVARQDVRDSGLGLDDAWVARRPVGAMLRCGLYDGAVVRQTRVEELRSLSEDLRDVEVESGPRGLLQEVDVEPDGGVIAASSVLAGVVGSDGLIFGEWSPGSVRVQSWLQDADGSASGLAHSPVSRPHSLASSARHFRASSCTRLALSLCRRRWIWVSCFASVLWLGLSKTTHCGDVRKGRVWARRQSSWSAGRGRVRILPASGHSLQSEWSLGIRPRPPQPPF